MSGASGLGFVHVWKGKLYVISTLTQTKGRKTRQLPRRRGSRDGRSQGRSTKTSGKEPRRNDRSRCGSRGSTFPHSPRTRPTRVTSKVPTCVDTLCGRKEQLTAPWPEPENIGCLFPACPPFPRQASDGTGSPLLLCPPVVVLSPVLQTHQYTSKHPIQQLDPLAHLETLPSDFPRCFFLPEVPRCGWQAYPTWHCRTISPVRAFEPTIHFPPYGEHPMHQGGRIMLS